MSGHCSVLCSQQQCPGPDSTASWPALPLLFTGAAFVDIQWPLSEPGFALPSSPSLTCSLPFVHFHWRNVYSSSLPTFKLAFEFFFSEFFLSSGHYILLRSVIFGCLPHGLASHHTTVSFETQSLTLIKVQSICFSLVSEFFVRCKAPLLSPGPQRFTPVFS